MGSGTASSFRGGGIASSTRSSGISSSSRVQSSIGKDRPWERKTEQRFERNDRGSSKGKGTGNSKGKHGKGKGKRRGAAALKSEFWVRKVDEEDRTELTGTFTGTVEKYHILKGWGFIEPDDADAFPSEAKERLEEANAKLREAGKEIKNENLIYFRKPDVEPESLRSLDPGQAVTFELYIDNKGCGAINVASASS